MYSYIVYFKKNEEIIILHFHWVLSNSFNEERLSRLQVSLKSSRKPVLNFKKSSSSSRLIKSFFNLKKKIDLP